jgi:hypothetical protein
LREGALYSLGQKVGLVVAGNNYADEPRLPDTKPLRGLARRSHRKSPVAVSGSTLATWPRGKTYGSHA